MFKTIFKTIIILSGITIILFNVLSVKAYKYNNTNKYNNEPVINVVKDNNIGLTSEELIELFYEY